MEKIARVGFGSSKYFKKISKISEKKFIKKYEFNFSNFQATIGLDQLKTFNELLDVQNRNAEQIKTLQNEFIPSNVSPAYFLCCISMNNRQGFSKYMFKSGVLVGYAHYPVLPDMEIFEKYKCNCPNARIASNIITYVPFRTHLKEKGILKILEVMKGYDRYSKHKSYFPAYTTSVTNLKP